MSPLGQRCHCQEGGECILRGNKTLKSGTQGFCFNTFLPNPTSNRVLMVTDHRISPSSHLALSLATPSPNSPHAKVITASTHWRKMWPVLNSDPAFPSKLVGTCILHRGTPTQRHPFRTKIGNCFTLFHWNRVKMRRHGNLFRIKEEQQKIKTLKTNKTKENRDK